MTPSMVRSDLDRFRSLVSDRLGLQLDDKLDLLSEVLHKRVAACRTTSEAYLRALDCESDGREERRALASYLTVPETYFLRYPDQFRALAETVLPQRICAQASARSLRLLSAGCASGEEPFSMAMTVRDSFPELAGWDVGILGVDVNAAALAKARRARYYGWSLRETPADVRQRHFHPQRDHFEVNDSIRSMVTFEEHNLAASEPQSWERVQFDVIFCRNVLMYLVPALARRAVERLSRALAPEGFLFLGHAETLRGLSQEFQLCHTQDTFYYRKRTGVESPDSLDQPPALAAPPIPAGEGGWAEVIRMASERIERLAGNRDRGPVAARVVEPAKAGMLPGAEKSLALDLLGQERFREALEILRRLPLETASDPDTQLLRAVLLINCGEIDAAESVCRQILSADDLDASAHYVMGLCRESAGDFAAAVEQDRIAAYLDPAFAMPHLHLGLLAKRSRSLDTARRELEAAATLLQREDSSRILLLGGGFGRQALLELAGTELRMCGGPR